MLVADDGSGIARRALLAYAPERGTLFVCVGFAERVEVAIDICSESRISIFAAQG